MKKIRLNIYIMVYKSTISYIKELDGIYSIESLDDDTLEIVYDENIIGLNRILMEIKLELNINHSILLTFDKCSNYDEIYTKVIEKDSICCEYCFYSYIEKLYETDGIISIDHPYPNKDFNLENIDLTVKYDSKIISREELIKIVDEY